MQDLIADKVFPTWPRPGEAAIRCKTDFLDDEVKEAMADPAYLVVNGAGGVTKIKEINGQQVQLQRFFSVLIPMNEMMMELPGAQDTLPYVGQLTSLYLLYLGSEDLQSAFNFLRVPRAWSPCFARWLGFQSP